MKMTWDGIGGEDSQKSSGLIERLQKSASRRQEDRKAARPSSASSDTDWAGQGGGALEPGGPGRAFTILRLLVFAAAVLWVLASLYRDPMLASAARFLIVAHPLEKADMVVCLSGSPVDRGLEAVQLIEEGYADRVFIPREDPLEGIRVLHARGAVYPESRELVFEMLSALGLPSEALASSDIPAGSIAGEALLVRNVAIAEGYRKIIVVTSPQQSRRAWIAFRHFFKDTDVGIIVRPTRFSGFQPDNWWKSRYYLRDVMLEYLKIVWYLWAL